MPPLNKLARGILFWSAATTLGAPLFDVLVTKRWERQLNQGFLMAFERAVVGVLSNTYHGKFNRNYCF